MRRFRRVVTCVVLTAAGIVVASQAPVSAVYTPTLHAVDPARLLDTRGTGTVDGLFNGGVTAPKLLADSTLALTVAGRGGVPADAGAVALNVTAINPSAGGFITVSPTGTTRPNASNLNLATGRTLPNMVIAKIGTAGQIDIYNKTGTVDVSVDVLGWFPDSTAAYGALDPARLLETRSGNPSLVTVDHLFEGGGPLGAGGTVDLTVAGRGGVPGNAGAVAVNVTAINPSAGGFITVYPTGSTRPNASNLNLATGRTLPNMVIAKVGTGGKITLYNQTGSVDLAVDVMGWFPDSATAYGALAPGRLLETRSGNPSLVTVDHLFEGGGPLGAASKIDLTVAGRGGVPADAGAVALNVTAINPSSGGYITVYPTGTLRPNASNLNLATGRTLPNMVIAKIGAGGKISIYNNLGSVDLAVDVMGWFPDAGPTVHTSIVSISTGGAQANIAASYPSISADGRYVAFTSSSTTLVTPDTNGGEDVFLRDTVLGTTIRVSVATDGTQADGSSFFPSVSADGRYVAFESVATNLVADDTNAVSDVFVRDTVGNTTTRVSLTDGSAQAAKGSFAPSISGTGRYVAFWSSGALVSADTNTIADVFVRDTVGNTTARASLVNGGGQAPAFGTGSVNPSISADGNLVAFSSDAALVTGDGNNKTDVFVHNMTTGSTVRASVDSSGTEGNGVSNHAVISGDGSTVAFLSTATNLVASDTNAVADVFAHHLAGGATVRVSVDSAGTQANLTSTNVSISGTGRFVAFDSYASNLVAGDTNGGNDVFVRDTTGLTTVRASVSTLGVQGDGVNPSISSTGRYVAFAAGQATLVPGDADGVFDIFLRDLAAP